MQSNDKEKSRARLKEALSAFREDFFKSIIDKIFAISNISQEREAYPDMLLAQVLVEDLNDNYTHISDVLPTERARNYILNEFLPQLAKNLILNRTYNWPDCQKCSDVTLWECQKLFLNLFPQDNHHLAEMAKLIWDADRSYYKVNNIDENNQKPFGAEIRPTEQRMTWLQNLKVGDLIDAIKTEPIQAKQGWSRGVVALMKEKIYVRFMEESEEYNTSFHHPFSEIAPYGSHSVDWDWRTNLKVGDEIDVCDPSNVWYASTVLELRVVNQGSQKVKEAYIGYRIFREDAEKMDSDTRKRYFGWSCRYDEWMNVLNPRIQPFGSIARKPLALNNMNNEAFDDTNDIVYEEEGATELIFANQHKFVINRQKFCKSSSLILWVNTLGSLGLFDRILERITDRKNWCPIDLLSNILLAIGNLHGMFYRKFALDYLQKLLDASMQNVLESPESNFRNFTKDKIEGVIQGLEKIVKRLYPAKERYEVIENFTLKVALQCFKSSILERKIQGLKTIQDIIKSIKYNEFKSIGYKDLGAWLEKNQVFDDIYGSGSHSQLIQRSSEFLRFLINEDLLTLENLIIIWQGIDKGDIQSKLSIYKMISDLSMSFNAQSVEFLIERISEMEISKITKDEIDLLYELARFSNKSGDFSIKALSFLWKILGESKSKVSRELYEFVLEKTGDLVSSYYLKEYRMTIMEKCIKNIEDNYGVYPSLKIMNKTLGVYPEKVLGQFSTIQTSKAMICEDLLKRCNVVEVIFKNLITFKSLIREKVHNIPIGERSEAILNKYIKDHTGYLEHIMERVLTMQNILKSLPDENPLRKDFTFISRLWGEIVDNCLIPQEENVLFRWIRELCDIEKEQTAKESSDTERFLQDKILSNVNLVEILSMDGLHAFKNIFLTVNRNKKTIEIISKSPEKEEYSNYPSAQASEEKIPPSILVLDEPDSLEGIEFLWSCCLENVSEDVSNKAVEFLLELYINNIKTSEEFIIKIRSDFIRKCFSVIQECCELNKKAQSPFFTRKIIRTITAITSFLDESEKLGIGNLKSHNANIKGEILTLTVFNDSITVSNNAAKSVEVKLSSSETLFGLRLEIAKQLQTSWDVIKLTRVLGGKELKDKENGWTLGELRIKNGEKFQGKRRPVLPVPEANLLNSDGSLNPRLLKIITEWFETFSTAGKMSHDECANFMNSCLRYSNDATANAGDKKVRDHYDRWDDDEDGYLTLDNFIAFYRNAASNRPRHVWGNLASHHYRNDLRKENEVEINEVNVRVLPRFLISQNPEYYHILFGLIQENGRIADDVWRLLNRLPTSPEIQKKVMSLEGVKGCETVDWNGILDIHNNYLLLYSLNVFEYMMEDESPADLQMESDRFRTDFIQYGGFEHLFNIFKVYNEKNRSLLTFLDKNILNFILKIVRNYVIAALCNKIPSLYRISQLIKMTYLNLDTIVELFSSDSAKRDEDKKLEGARKKLEETLEHRRLADKLAGELGDKILGTTDLNSFKDGLIQLGLDILDKTSDEFESEERGILELIQILLTGIYLYSKDILETLISPGKHDDFFLKGLFFYKSSVVRRTFCRTIFLLVTERKETIGTHYLGLLIQNIPDGSQIYLKECMHFYEVLNKLLEQCSGVCKLDYGKLAEEMIERIQKHQSQETRSRPVIDTILAGYLSLLGTILELFPEIRVKQALFAFELFEEGLFDIKAKENLYKDDYVYEVANKTAEKDMINNYVKFKCPHTRKTAYKILTCYVKENPALFEELLDKSIIPLLKIAPRTDKTWIFSPLNNGRSNDYAGIRNLGCICYMTAMIQQFFMNSQFRYALLRASDSKPPIQVPYSNNSKIAVDDNILHQMQKLFVFLELTDRQDYNPFEYCFSFKDYAGQPVNVLMQQDAQEFINMIFDKLENSLRNTAFSQVLENVYGGKYCNQMICTNCKQVTNRFESFYNLSLQVKNMKNIYESLNKYIAGETISDYMCENCNKKVEITKRYVLSSLPNVLIIHLQRLVFNLDTLMNEKINSRLDFPVELNLLYYMKDEIEKREKETAEQEKEKENHPELQRATSNLSEEPVAQRKGSQMEEKMLEKQQSSMKSSHEKGYYEYKLKGVVNHTGSAEAGHYYSFINLDGKKWLEFNDSTIKDFDVTLIEQECFGGSNGFAMADGGDDYMTWEGKENAKSAYILVYERKSKEPFVLKVDENPDSTEAIADLEKKPVDGSPNTFTVDYYGMTRYIPENYYELVWNDNHEFMREKHIYNEDFFTFVYEFFGNFPSFPFKSKDKQLPFYFPDHSSLESLKPLAKKCESLLLQYLSEILYRANDKNTLPDTTRLIRGFILISPETAVEMAQTYIFSRQKEIFELLLSCSELGVRTSISQILHTFTTVIIEHHSLFDEVERSEEQQVINDQMFGFLGNLLSLMPNEVGKNWTKFQQYFDFWRDFAMSGKKYVDFLNTKEFIAILIDFFLERKSPLLNPGQADKRPKMGNQYQKPAFEVLLQCLSLVISEDFNVQNLTEKERQCLNCQEFYERGIEEKYNYILISKICEKIVIENAQMSKNLAFIILKGMNKAYDEVEPYLHLMGTLLSIQDSLQEQRFEQILGYPQLIYNRYDNFGMFEGIEEQYYCYESTLPWSGENISVLNYIYQNKKRWEVLCSVCLCRLLQVLDQNDAALRFVAMMPGPSYIYNSYFDWIKPFVNEYLEEAKRLNYPKYSQEKIEKCNEIMKSYNSIEAKLIERQRIIETPKESIISFISDYEPIMFGKTIREKKVTEEILYKKKDDLITLSIYEFEVYVIPSNPTTLTNLAIPALALNRNEFQNREIHPDSTFFRMVNSYFWDESRRRKLLGKKGTEETAVDEDDEEEVKRKDNGDNSEDTLLNKPKKGKKKSNLTIEVPHEKTGEKIENSKEESKECINYDAVENSKEDKEKNKKIYPMINLPIEEVACIRRYVLRNDTKESVQFELKFSVNPKIINAFFPQSICKKIMMQTTQPIVTLLKKRRNEDWPDSLSFEYNIEFSDHVIITENSISNSNNGKVLPCVSSYPAADDYIDDAPNGKKKCHLCYTSNEANAEKCNWCSATLY